MNKYDFIDCIKEKLSKYLGIRCIFPCSINLEHNNEILVRCILEKDLNDKNAIAFDKLQEDIIARCRNSNKLTVNGVNIGLNEIINESLVSLFDDVEIINLVENNTNMPRKEIVKPRLPSTSKHPGLSSTFKLIESDSDIIILQDYTKHSILSLSRFHAKTTLASPTLGRTGGPGSRDLRLRFIIYQLLQVLSFVHSKKLVLNKLIPSDISLDDNMWLTLPYGISDRACLSSLISLLKKRKFDLQNFTTNIITKIHRPVDYYSPITSRWIEGKISNFEYLMAINHAAGRTMVDPLYHPILPWITDFTCDPPNFNNGYRDLSKTKFRLSKGDPQLETTYKHSDPPHHVPESLSELTYYIYMARRTPLQVLRRVVRDVFVPEHYPHSIARMYDWTPDECIPEFFYDVNVFTSIHQDLGLLDLELPSFASTPSEFISYHQRLFEGDYVSSNIHHWIDLTFGFCLDGLNAINNMNVPLKHTLTASERLGDISHLDKHPGFIMLFNKPHPKKNVVRSFHHDPALKSSSKIKLTRKSSVNYTSVCDKATNSLGDLQAFVNLDYKYHLNNRLKRKQDKKFNLLESNHNDNKNSTIHNYQSYGNNISRRSSKLSLSNSFEFDNTWNHLTLAEDVDISSYYYNANNISSYSYDFKFSYEYNSFLQPNYLLAQNDFSLDMANDFYESDDNNCRIPIESNISNDKQFKNSLELSKQFNQDTDFWDDMFIKDLNKLLLNYKDTNTANNNSDDIDDIIESLQSQDMFSLGCIIAEIYLGRPILNKCDINILTENQTKISSEIIHKIYDNTDNISNQIPLGLKRLIAILLLSNSQFNVLASDILQSCTCIDYDLLDTNMISNLQSSGNTIGYYNFEDVNKTSITKRKSNQIFNILNKYCFNIFPNYFHVIYKFIGEIKLAKNGIKRFNILLLSLKDFLVLPLEGIGLVLPHILTIISDSKPFRLDSNMEDVIDGNTVNKKYDDPSEKFDINDYSTIIDIIGQRLGIETTDKIIIPRVLDFLNTLNSPKNLQLLLVSPLWNVIIIRAGVKSFLKYFYPLLLTYLSSSILQNISIGSTCYHDTGGISPIWATMGISDKTEWLHLCSKSDLKYIQESTVLVLSNLVDPGGLGIGLCARYIIPSLICLIGSPQFSVAGFRSYSNDIKDRWNQLRESILTNTENQDYISQKVIEIEKFLNYQILNDTQDMYTVHALVGICSQLNDIVISELVLSKVFDELLPDLESLFKIPIPSPSTISALMEIMLLLNGILPNLSIDTITKYYLQSYKSIKSYCLPKLLVNLPLTVYWSVTDDVFNKNTICDIDIYLESERRYSLLFEFIRLVVSTSMIVGSNICIEYVLPSVDKFFQIFIETFSSYHVESKAMQRAFELGAELYMSLENLTGQAFYTSVQSLNPRLQVWLSSVGSGVSNRKSPPLPSNILAEEAVVDVSQSNNDKKKKGMFTWISNTSSSSTKFRDNFISIPTFSYPSKILSSSSSTSNSSNNVLTSRSFERQSSNDVTIASESTNDRDSNRLSLKSEQIDICHSNSNELSPVATNLLLTTNKQRQNSLTMTTIRTPFEKLKKAANNVIVNDDTTYTSTIDSISSVTEGMELRAMERFNGSNNSSPIAKTLNFNDEIQFEEKVENICNNDSDSINNENTNNMNNYVELEDHDELDNNTKATIADIENNDNNNEIAGKSNVLNIDTDTDEDLSSDELDQFIDDTPTNHTPSDDLSYKTSISLPALTDALLVRPSTLVKNYHQTHSTTASTTSQSTLGSIPISLPNPSNFFRKLLSGQHTSSLSNTLQNLRKGSHHIDSTSNKLSKVGNMILSVSNRKESDQNVDDDEYYNDISWLLAGHSKWNNDQHALANPSYNSTNNSNNNTLSNIQDKQYRIYRSNYSTNNNANNTSSNNIYKTNFQQPPAQISMTSPRITVDVAFELGTLFTLGMNILTQWKADESNYYYNTVNQNITNNNNSSAATLLNNNVKCLTVNSTESLLLSCSKVGTKLWSLNTNPVKQLATYPNSYHSIPYFSSFLRSGIQILTCDGNITVWDVESSSVLNYLTCPGNSTGLGFTSVSVIPSKFGITPGIAPYGDDQLVTSSLGVNSHIIGHYDFRLPSTMKPVSEWYLHHLPLVNNSSFTTQSSIIEHQYISAICSSENYLYAGSNNGGLYVLDRRMGKVLSSWQGHDSTVLKIYSLNDSQFLTVAERSASVWTSTDSEFKKVYNIKNMPESTTNPLLANTVMLSTYESTPSQNNLYQHPDMRSSLSPIRVLYGIAGHKMYGSRIKSTDDISHQMNNNNNDIEDIRLVQTYFNDRNKQKIPKGKLNVTCAVFLPLRRLLLLGTDDGYIKVVS